MEVDVPAGKYIVAVSGGVDSMVLLDLLAKRPELELVVAHFDHGIRPDSHEDAQLVADAAKKYGLPIEIGQGHLGPKASEEKARQARYAFLEKVKDEHKAGAIITAHHQDDLIETALINVLRGTGPQGLVSLADTANIRRPLLAVPKQTILKFAKKNEITWREDPSNVSPNYLRNYIRHNIASKLSQAGRRKLLSNIEKVAKLRSQSTELIATFSHLLLRNNRVDRTLFTSLPIDVSNELLTFWFKRNSFRNFDRKTIQKANIFIRTAQPGSSQDLLKSVILCVDKASAWLENRG